MASSSKGTTAVAMSGGVDSSAAACLLSSQRDQLVGFSMQLVNRLEGEEQRYGRCCSPEDFQDARAVADKLGIPHYIIDMEREFQRSVLDPFLDDYAQGRTPSPCVRCNTFIKFGALVGRARAVGAERVATGHYAILEDCPRSGRTLLRRAADPDKDQSYYLFDLSDEQRKLAEFPLGGMTKSEVRELARAHQLANADKPESMDLCFVDRTESYRDYLKRRGIERSDRVGEIVDRKGASLGQHDGISGFTVGQRKWLGLTSPTPLYVLQIDSESSRVVVGKDDELLEDRCVIERTRWIPFEKLGGELRATVRIRAGHEGAQATIRDLGDRKAEIRFDEPQRAVSPGQAAVAYDGDYVLGGGWISPRQT
jgi:tRNA-specific 2-thiouridylase